MPHDRQPPDQPREWLNRAASDLAIAEHPVSSVYLEDLCYHAQQCAEKSLKAVLLHFSGKFPYIHDLAELVNQINLLNIPVPPEIVEAVGLTEFAVEGRYPGFNEPVTEEAWNLAVSQAQSVLSWARQIIPSPPGKTQG